MHNDAVAVFGSCRCACHRMRAALALCWCDPARALRAPAVELSDAELADLRRTAERAGLWLDAPRIAHNDYVRHFGACRCLCHTRATRSRCWCSGPTDPEVARALDRKDRRDLERRLRTGRARPEEYLRHAPHLLAGMTRPRPRP